MSSPIRSPMRSPMAAPRCRQRGATLMIALTMLAFMLMSASAATRLLLLEQQGAHHWRAQLIARLAAQAALDDALDHLRSGRGRNTAQNDVIYGQFTARRAHHADAGIAPPVYRIEELAPQRTDDARFRLHATGFGPSGARVRLQAVVHRDGAGEQARFTLRAWRQLASPRERTP